MSRPATTRSSSNGAKLVQRRASALLPEEIQEVRRLAESGDLDHGRGALDERDPKPEYLALLAERFRLARPLTVVADPGNGVATLDWAGGAAADRL